MATVDFLSRIVGLFVFTILGARFGTEISGTLEIPSDASALVFGLVGALFGLIMTPWVIIRPVQFANQSTREMPVETFIMLVVGAFVGLILALLMAYPLSLMPQPFGEFVPPALSIILGYLGITIFRVRAREIWQVVGPGGGRRGRILGADPGRQLLLDTSVLIDGRIVDIAKSGFLGGALIIPRFVMTELHQVADSSDQLRRNRGRRGLVKVNELQRNDVIAVKIIDDDIEGINEVDDKLVALAMQMDALLVTNDYPLGKVAESQGVSVLNINILANAVRSIYIPGETFPLHIIQEGTDSGQGVGYLDDGTMVVVESGRRYMDRTVEVMVTKLINREAGRMIFAQPANER